MCNLGPSRQRQNKVGYFPSKSLLRPQGQYCTSNFLVQFCLTYLDNIEYTIFLCNVFPAWQTQHCIVYFAKKSYLLTMEIAQVYSLRNVGPLRSRQHWILFSCAKVLDLSWVLDQHCTCSLREQCWHRQIKKTLYSLFPAKTCLSALGLHCTSNFPAQCCLRHFWATLT